jgi:hypothetical protein
VLGGDVLWQGRNNLSPCFGAGPASEILNRKESLVVISVIVLNIVMMSLGLYYFGLKPD